MSCVYGVARVAVEVEDRDMARLGRGRDSDDLDPVAAARLVRRMARARLRDYGRLRKEEAMTVTPNVAAMDRRDKQRVDMLNFFVQMLLLRAGVAGNLRDSFHKMDKDR